MNKPITLTVTITQEVNNPNSFMIKAGKFVIAYAYVSNVFDVIRFFDNQYNPISDINTAALKDPLSIEDTKAIVMLEFERLVINA